VRHVLPIFEVVPTANGPTKDAYRFGDKVHESLPADLTIAVDVRHLADPTNSVRRPMRDLADDLAAWLIPMLPVLRLDDSPARIADVRYAADLQAATRFSGWAATPKTRTTPKPRMRGIAFLMRPV
jgi:hypothetical protein